MFNPQTYIRLSNYVSNTDTKSCKEVMRKLRDELDLAEKHKEECHKKMLQICKTYYPKELARLMTIPGIKERAATSLIAEIGVDMTKFATAGHLAAWSEAASTVCPAIISNSDHRG